MLLVSFLSLLYTSVLVAISHVQRATPAETNLLQLLGLGAVLLVGAVTSYLIARDQRFDRIRLRDVLLLAAALRLLVCFGVPLLENDYFRYLWDAYRFAHSGTPYDGAPAAYFIDGSVPPAFRAILQQVNYPEISTIYGPITELLFLMAYLIAPAQVGALQALNGLLDLLLIWMLAKAGAKSRWLLLYAISPLVLKEFVMTAHPDALLGLLLVASLVSARRSWLAGWWMGLALACKVSAVVVLPLLWKRAGWRGMVAAALACLACYLPFVWQPGSELFALKTFAQVWRFNPLGFALLEPLLDVRAQRWASAILLGGMLLWIYWSDWINWINRYKGDDRRRTGFAASSVAPADLALGSLLFLAPVVNPWYLLWLLPFAVLRPSRTAWATSFVLPLSYWNGANLVASGEQVFGVPVWITVIELGVLAGMMLWDWRMPIRHHADTGVQYSA